jgi:hypothetical protein
MRGSREQAPAARACEGDAVVEAAQRYGDGLFDNTIRGANYLYYNYTTAVMAMSIHKKIFLFHLAKRTCPPHALGHPQPQGRRISMLVAPMRSSRDAPAASGP